MACTSRPVTAHRRPSLSVFAAVLVAVLAALCTLALAAAPVAAAPPEVAAQLSRDTEAALLVPDLAETNRKLADLRERLELPVPAMDDLLTAFKSEAKMSGGIDDNGAMAIVFQGLDGALKNESDPVVFLLIPITDYDAFVANYEGSADETVTELTMPRHVAYARQLGEFALLGKTRDGVANYQTVTDTSTITRKLGSFGEQYMGAADAALYVDLEQLRPTLMQLMGDSDAPPRPPNEDEDEPSIGAPLDPVSSMLQEARPFLRNVIESSTSLVLTLELGEQGIALTKTLNYAPDSSLAQLLGAATTSTRDELARLPDHPYILALAMDTRAVAIGQMLQDQLENMEDVGDVDDVDDAGDASPTPGLVLSARALPLIEQVRSASTVLYVPTQQALMSGGFLDTVDVYRVEDADQFRQQFQSYIEGLNGLSVPAGAAGDGDHAPEISFTTDYTANALNITGANVDQYRVQRQLPPELQSQMGHGPLASMTNMQGITGYLITHGDHVARTTRPDPQLVREALNAMQNSTGLGSGEAMQTQRDLAMPPNPAIEGHLSVHGVGKTANLILNFLPQDKLNVPDDLPPISFGVSIEGHNAAGRMYLPMRSVRFIIDARDQLFDSTGADDNGRGPMHGPGGDVPPPDPYR